MNTNRILGVIIVVLLIALAVKVINRVDKPDHDLEYHVERAADDIEEALDDAGDKIEDAVD